MASRRPNPFSRFISKATQRPADPNEAPEDGKSSVATAASPVAAAPVEPRSAAVEAAAQTIRDRTAGDELKPGGRRADDAVTKTEPSTPGQQSNDSGVNTGGTVGAGGLEGRRAAPGTDSTTSQLDQAAQAALDQLAQSRADLRGPGDVFEAADGSVSAPPDSSNGARDQLGTRPADLFGNSGNGDGGSEHAEDVVGQLLSGGGSLFENRRAGVEGDIAIGAGLIADQNTRASSPSVADGSNPLGDAVNSVTPEDRANAANAAGVTPDSGGTTAPDLTKFQKAGNGFATAAEAEEANEKGLVDRAIDFIRNASAPTNVNQAQQLQQVDDGIGKAGESQTVSEGHEAAGIKNLEVGVGKALGGLSKGSGGGAGGGVKDPGDPDAIDGPPTAAQIAFRQQLQASLGIRPQGSGDIDPTDDGTGTAGTGGARGALVDTPNNNESLIGQPAGPGSEVGGSGHTGPLPGGTDIDPLEGSAFTGPSRGGNPEDLQFGSTTLGLDAARRATSGNDDDDDDDAEEEDK